MPLLGEILNSHALQRLDNVGIDLLEICMKRIALFDRLDQRDHENSRGEDDGSPPPLLMMPAYGPDVTDEEVRAIAAYIAWLRGPTAGVGR